jgi:hypothetical protein
MLLGALMLLGGGWFVFDALRTGYVDIGTPQRGQWSATWPDQPLQFGCLLLIWIGLGALGLLMVVASASELALRDYPLAAALLLVPWAAYSSWYRVGGPQPIYLEDAAAALRAGDRDTLEQLQGRIRSAAVCQLIGYAGRWRLPADAAPPTALGYRQPGDRDAPRRAIAVEALRAQARSQLRRLWLGWAPGLAALSPIPVLVGAGASWEADAGAFSLATLLLLVFALVSRSTWRAHRLVRSAPEVLAAAIVEAARFERQDGSEGVG